MKDRAAQQGAVPQAERRQKREKPKYLEAVVAFDLETTSYMDDGEKRAIIYTYTVSVNGRIHIMRTKDEFLTFMKGLVERNGLHKMRRVVIYVHNLPYEFAFIKGLFEWLDVFVNGEARNVIRATTVDGIEFRCSYALTNASLAQVGKEIGIPKMEGDLDYSLMRHSETPLTPEEIQYIENDVLIIDALIKNRLQFDTYTTMPMTKTGYIRRKVRNKVRKDPSYTRLIEKLALDSKTYTLASQAYAGGYTHANANYTEKIVNGVAAVDLASSYPASLIQFTYPVSRFTEVRASCAEEFEALLNNGACILDVTMEDIDCKYNFPLISESRLTESDSLDVDNGRVYSAGMVRMMVTDVDYRQLMRNYNVGGVVVNQMWVARSDYLPTPLVESILDLYKNKTLLKDNENMKAEYGLAKADVNGVYGMMGTDPVRMEFEMLPDGTPSPLPLDVDAALESHNNGRSRFLYFPWGAWVTAYSRYVLLETIMDLEDAGYQVLYCDTDSIYYIWDPQALEIVAAANQRIRKRTYQALEHHGYTAEEALEYAEPMDGNSVVKDRRRWPLGIFEEDTAGEDGTPGGALIQEFKTLGAKRYAKVDSKGKFGTTVAGLSKKAAPFIEANGGMEFFKDGMYISSEDSGRLTHTYSDMAIANKLTDYLGNVAEVEQIGFVHLEPSDYKLTISADYERFLFQLNEVLQVRDN